MLSFYEFGWMVQSNSKNFSPCRFFFFDLSSNIEWSERSLLQDIVMSSPLRLLLLGPLLAHDHWVGCPPLWSSVLGLEHRLSLLQSDPVLERTERNLLQGDPVAKQKHVGASHRAAVDAEGELTVSDERRVMTTDRQEGHDDRQEAQEGHDDEEGRDDRQEEQDVFGVIDSGERELNTGKHGKQKNGKAQVLGEIQSPAAKLPHKSSGRSNLPRGDPISLGEIQSHDDALLLRPDPSVVLQQGVVETSHGGEASRVAQATSTGDDTNLDEIDLGRARAAALFTVIGVGVLCFAVGIFWWQHWRQEGEGGSSPRGFIPSMLLSWTATIDKRVGYVALVLAAYAVTFAAFLLITRFLFVTLDVRHPIALAGAVSPLGHLFLGVWLLLSGRESYFPGSSSSRSAEQHGASGSGEKRSSFSATAGAVPSTASEFRRAFRDPFMWTGALTKTISVCVFCAALDAFSPRVFNYLQQAQVAVDIVIFEICSSSSSTTRMQLQHADATSASAAFVPRRRSGLRTANPFLLCLVVLVIVVGGALAAVEHDVFSRSVGGIGATVLPLGVIAVGMLARAFAAVAQERSLSEGAGGVLPGFVVVPYRADVQVVSTGVLQLVFGGMAIGGFVCGTRGASTSTSSDALDFLAQFHRTAVLVGVGSFVVLGLCSDLLGASLVQALDGGESAAVLVGLGGTSYFLKESCVLGHSLRVRVASEVIDHSDIWKVVKHDCIRPQVHARSVFSVWGMFLRED